MADTTWVDKITQFTVAWTQNVNDFVYRALDPLYTTSTGAANVYTITHLTNLKTGLVAGDSFSFKTHQTNIAGACTFNFVSSVGTFSKPITWKGSAPAAGAIISGQIITLRYDGTNMQLPVPASSVAASRLLGNPTGSAALTSEISLGGGLEFSGTAVQAAIGSGLELSGNDVQVALGSGLSLSGNDIQVDFPNVIPTGTVWQFGLAAAPTGWLACDGAAVSRTTYATLFAAISSTFGVGDGTNTFNLPDLRGRTAIGTGTGTYVSRFTSANIDTATDIITVPVNQSLITGTAVVYTATTTAATPLVSGNTYYIVRINSTSVKLASTLAVAQTTISDINLGPAGAGAMTFTITLTARTLGQVGGEETHAQNISELVLHDHTGAIGAGGAIAAGANFGSVDTGTAGGPNVMNNMQPWLGLLSCIKT